MRCNFTPAVVVLGVGLACAGCTSTYPVRMHYSEAGLEPAGAQRDRVVYLHDLRAGDDLTATLQSGAVKHFRLVSFDGKALAGERLVLGIGGIDRLEVRRNEALFAAGKVTRILGELLVLGAVDSMTDNGKRRVDQL